MTEAPCDEMQLLVQADIDGELTPAEAARMVAHLTQCSTCSQTQADLLAVSNRLRTTVPRYPASDGLKAIVHAHLAKAPARTVPEKLGRHHFPLRGRATAFGAGFALAACLALVLVVPGGTEVSDAVVAAHIRALQPGHLMDVASRDQHTVKPWFDGRLPFAPPVKDLKSVGFPLAGGRLDYLAGHTAAALVYLHGAHDINLFVWPDAVGAASKHGSLNGYNFERWSQDGMTYWAVTDLNAQDLADFVERWRAL